MTKPSQPVTNLADIISAEDLRKIQEHKLDTSGHMPVDNEWLIMACWLKIAGWEGYMALKNDEISLAEVLTILEAERRLDYGMHYRNAEASFIGAISAGQKKPAQLFKKLTKDIIKQTKVE